MNKLDLFGSVGRLLRLNWRPLVIFELFFKVTLAIVLIPVVSGAVNLAMRMSGFAYVTVENVVRFALHPVTLAMMLATAFLAATFDAMDIGAVIYLLDQSAQGVRARPGRVLRFSFRSALRIWRPANLPLAVVMLLLFPFMNIALILGAISVLPIPEFVYEFFRTHAVIPPLFFGTLFVMSLLLTRWLYAFHYYAMEGCAALEAFRRSAALSRGHRLGDFFALLVAQGLFGGLAVGASMLLALLAAALGRHTTVQMAEILLMLAAALSLAIVFGISTPLSQGIASGLYYQHRRAAGERVTHIVENAPASGISRRKRLATYLAASALLTAGCLYVGGLYGSGALNPPIEQVRVMEITAHRGASSLYPENTMAAFRGAWELGADWVELDVQQTKDGQLIIMHDPNTRRTTGVPGNVWDMTYEQISKLDAGSSFSREFAGEPVPLLSEACQYARDVGVRMNIELKPTGHETNFEQSVIDVIREYELVDRCVITSQVYGTLRRVKECDPEITTVYVTSLAYGAVNHLSAADHFSLKASSATKTMVSRMHNVGKQVYAWTVNNARSMNRMIERGVDNIITDNVELARQCVRQSRYSQLLSEVVSAVE